MSKRAVTPEIEPVAMKKQRAASQQDTSEADVSYQYKNAGAQTEPPRNNGQADTEGIKAKLFEMMDDAAEIDLRIEDPLDRLAAYEALHERGREWRQTIEPPSVSLDKLPPLPKKMDSGRSYLLNVVAFSFVDPNQKRLVVYPATTNEPSSVPENWTIPYQALRQKVIQRVGNRMPNLYPDISNLKSQLRIKFVAQLAGLDGEVAPMIKAADFDTWTTSFLDTPTIDRKDLSQYPRLYCYVYARSREDFARDWIEKKHGVSFGETETTNDTPAPRPVSRSVRQDGIPTVQSTNGTPASRPVRKRIVKQDGIPTVQTTDDTPAPSPARRRTVKQDGIPTTQNTHTLPDGSIVHDE